jgi:predicted PurR-regulated permease PerM
MSSSLFRFLHRQEEEPKSTIASSTHEASHAHDPIVRYAVVGIFVIMATGVLWVSKSISLPIVAGVIFGLVLGPIVDRLVRLGIPQGLAAGSLVGLGALLVVGLIAIFAAPFALWSDQLPKLVETLRSRLSGLLSYVRRMEGMAGDLTPGSGPKVTVADGSPLVDLAVTSSSAAAGMLIFAATIYFYLATRRHLKTRILRLCLGGNARQLAGSFFEQIEQKVAAYFGVVTLVNFGIGCLTALIASIAELPFPILWGAIAFMLNYVMFIGPIILVVLLVGAGLTNNATLWGAFAPAIIYYVLHLVEGNVVTPVAIGRRLTISPFLIFISFVFWLWLWGPIGAVLSTPILLVGVVATDTLASYRAIEADQAIVKLSETPDEPIIS